jgi:hypothetical protein
MAVRYSTRIGLDSPGWYFVGPGCRVIADAAFAAVVINATVSFRATEWWAHAGAVLLTTAYLAIPERLESLFLLLALLWIASSQIVTLYDWVGLLAGAALTDTSTAFVAALTIIVAMSTTPADYAVTLTFALAICITAVIAYMLFARPTRKLTPTSLREVETADESTSIVPRMIM